MTGKNESFAEQALAEIEKGIKILRAQRPLNQSFNHSTGMGFYSGQVGKPGHRFLGMDRSRVLVP
jgi:hypothetical protein